MYEKCMLMDSWYNCKNSPWRDEEMDWMHQNEHLEGHMEHEKNDSLFPLDMNNIEKTNLPRKWSQNQNTPKEWIIYRTEYELQEKHQEYENHQTKVNQYENEASMNYIVLSLFQTEILKREYNSDHHLLIE